MTPPDDRREIARMVDLVVVAWAVFALVHVLGRRWTLVAIHVLAFLVAGLGARLARRSELGTVIVAGASFAALWSVAVLTGGSTAPALGYLSLLPLVTGLFRGRRARLVGLVVGLLGIVTVPLAARAVPATVALEASVPERVLWALALALLLYRFGAAWRASTEAARDLLDARRDTIERQAKEVQAAHDAAVLASERKSQFVAMTSHELRGPLNGILGMSHALADTRLGDHQRELVTALTTSAAALARLLSDLLDVARIEAGRVEIVTAPTDVRSLVGDVVDAFAPDAAEKGIDLAAVTDVDVPVTVRADAGRLAQVLRNLVSNAVKFTERGTVLVETSVHPTHLSIVVSDTGRGMEPDHIERIFLPFEQVSADLVDRRAGTGLGLWIARSVVEAWGGTIEVRSVPGQGTRFVVTVPCAADAGPQRFTTLVGMPEVLVVSGRSATNRAFLSVGREIDARVSLVPDLDHLDAGALASVRALVVDVASVGIGALGALAAHKLGPRLVLATSTTQVAEVERLAGPWSARVMLLPPRATRMLAALERARPALARRPSFHTVPPTDATMLVVDDDPISRHVARHAAQAIGLKVIEAASGAEALSRLATEPCDVVLLDQHLGEEAGDELARRIRRVRPALAIVACTGSVQERDRRRLLEAGVTEVVSKPLDRGTFAAAVDRALHNQSPSQRSSRSLKLDTIDGAALAELERIVGGPSALAETIREFLPALEERVRVVDEAARAGDLRRAEETAHALASSAATFGAQRLMLLSRTLETAAQQGARERVERLAHGLVEAAAESLPLLSDLAAEAVGRAAE